MKLDSGNYQLKYRPGQVQPSGTSCLLPKRMETIKFTILLPKRSKARLE